MTDKFRPAGSGGGLDGNVYYESVFDSAPAKDPTDLDLILLDGVEAELRRRFKSYPDVTIVRETLALFLPRRLPEGPDVTLNVSVGQLTLAVGPWHSDLMSLDSAVEGIEKAVQGRSRVRLDRLNGQLENCVLEELSEDGSWVERDVISFPRMALWSWRRDQQYLCNKVMSA